MLKKQPVEKKVKEVDDTKFYKVNEPNSSWLKYEEELKKNEEIQATKKANSELLAKKRKEQEELAEKLKK